MEKTLILLKPCTVQRRLIGEVINRIERKGLRIVGLKMMQLDDAILNEHYAHLVDRPFFPWLTASMKSAPVIAMCVEGNSAVTVVRNIVGATNGRKAAPGTIRGDFSMSGQENIIHASDSIETAEIEMKRFFREGEIFEYPDPLHDYFYAPDGDYREGSTAPHPQHLTPKTLVLLTKKVYICTKVPWKSDTKAQKVP